MSYHHKYDFVSPEPTYAIVKEELKSYFDTGAIDDLLFPTYLNKCLEKLGRSSFALVPVVLLIEDFTCRLPDNFYAAREAWFCTQGDGSLYTNPSSFYSQANSLTSLQLSPLTIGETNQCDNPVCNTSDCKGDCLPTLIQAVYKTQTSICRTAVKRVFLLKPGNISMSNDCQFNYNNDSDLYNNESNVVKPETHFSGQYDSFEIRDNKFVTTFRNGIVELLMYATSYDCEGSEMMPDNYRIKEFVELFIKFKMFEMLYHQTNDETFNQIEKKMMNYKQLSDEAYIMAELEIKKQSAWTKQRRIKKLKTRFDAYEINSASSRRNVRRHDSRRNY
jgi:hypothetical protein